MTTVEVRDGITVVGDVAPKIAVTTEPATRGYCYPLTVCHNASGKGLTDEDSFDGGYIGCRACFEEVNDLYGVVWPFDAEDSAPGFNWLDYTRLLRDEGVDDAARITQEVKTTVTELMTRKESK